VLPATPVAAAPSPQQTTALLPPADPAADANAAASNDNPTGRQEPAVSLEWIGPPATQLGQPVTFQVVIKNVSPGPVQNVVVRNRLPAGVTVAAVEPKPITEGNVLTWELGTLQPRQEKRLDLQLLPESKGDFACQSWVTFTGTSLTRFQVREPKLLVTAGYPQTVLHGDTTTITLVVSNPGDGTANRVQVKALLPEGLEHARGKTLDFDLGTLAPNESRSLQLVCFAKTLGDHRVDLTATAEGNLKAQDAASVHVVLPRVDLVVSGPRLRYLERPATYTFKVTNPGNAPATDVAVVERIPQGFKFVAASDGGRHDFAARTISWFIGDLTPGQTREVKLDLLAVNIGEHRHQASATGNRGIKTDAEIVTRVEGLSALLMELVDLVDPVEVGVDTSYEIRITNTGSKTETNLQLTCTLPEKMEFRSARGTGNQRYRVQGKEVIFEALPKLAPRADAIFRVNVRGLAPGDLRFRAVIRADGLTEPVLKEESTKVYGDDDPGK